MTAPATMSPLAPRVATSPGSQAEGRDHAQGDAQLSGAAALPFSPPSTTPYAVPNGAPSTAGPPSDRAQLIDDTQWCGGAVAQQGPTPVKQLPNWSPTARMRVHLVAESCMKQRHSPYRAVYDDGRAKYADAVHAAPCVRCGPAGKPAAAGSALSDGHKHARALRLVAKAVLRDLWREAKRLADDDNAFSGAA